MRLKAPSDTPAVTSDFAFQKLQDLALKEIAEALTVCFFTLHWHRRWTRGERSELRRHSHSPSRDLGTEPSLEQVKQAV